MEYSLEQLKVMAYDNLVQLERVQANLKEINNAIANYKEPEAKAKTEPKKAPKK